VKALPLGARRYGPIGEALALLAVTFPLAVGLRLPTLWLLIPLLLITVTKRSYDLYGLNLQRPGSLAFHLAVITAVFVPYAVGHYALWQWWYGAAFHLRLPEQMIGSVVDQVFIVALAEEFFFRGYLQTQCDQVWGKPYRLLGAEWGVGLPVAAALFALCHMLYGGPVRLVVFFPGLLYGWLRARSATIAVPVLYHAGSNLLMQIMLTSLSA
jgi:membrane protease YdiL (CAAX protease family)